MKVCIRIGATRDTPIQIHADLLENQFLPNIIQKKYKTLTVRENPFPVYCPLPHQYGQHLVSVLCTDDAVLMVNAEQHNLCLKLGIIQQVLKVLSEINQINKTAANSKHFYPCFQCKYTSKQYFLFLIKYFFYAQKG